jgi:hypothetical protein
MVKSLDQSLSLTPQWAATFKAFGFDPQRQDKIVRRLVGQRLLVLQGIDKPAAVIATETPASKKGSEDSKTSPADPLSSALVLAWDRPGNEEALGKLNAACFDLLHSRGAKVLQPPSLPRLTPAQITHLESAAQFKAPSALQLLGMMEVTGRGMSLNSTQGISHLEEAQKSLSRHPGMPFGPGIDKKAEPDALSGVGTAAFWLGECNLVGMPERDLGKACESYALAAHDGDGRATQRIHQLAELGLVTAADAKRWTGATTVPPLHGVLGLVELQKTSLATLYAKELRGRPSVRPPVVASSDDPPPSPAFSSSARPYFGIEMGPAPRGLAGVVAENVLMGSPADGARVRPRDLITGFDGIPIVGIAALKAAVDNARPGQRVIINGRHFQRGPFELSLTLGTVRPVTRSIECVEEPMPVPSHVTTGGLGIRVNSVVRGSRPEAAGLHSGDVVVAVAGVPIHGFQQLQHALQGHGGGVTLAVWRPVEGLDSAPVAVHIAPGY